MIYLFTWNNDYLVREKTLNWKNAYTQKFWDFNFVHFKEPKNVDNNIISSELLSEWFMWEKKLIIIDDIPLKSSEKNSELIAKQDFFDLLIGKIPENNIVIFSSTNPDKRGKFYKSLKKIATKVEEFNSAWDSDIISIINLKYLNKISNEAVLKLVRFKSWNLSKIVSEIDKLLILKEKISIQDVTENIFPELEESIFQLVDDIMNCNINNAIEKLNIILSQVSVYAFYNNLIANLRPLVFILNLKNKKINSTDISNILDLKNRAFLVNKNYRISSVKLNNLFIGLINLDKKMKSWSMIWSEENILKYEIEKELLKIKI